MSEVKPHKRVNDILLGPLERPALKWLAGRMPPWVNPDTLTVIGILGAVVIFAGYVLSLLNRNFLWLAIFGYFVNWFGDSLDGTLARYRKIERPKYGFFVDHTVDAFSQVLIFLGFGLSPYLSFGVASVALVGYLLMSIYVYVDTYVTGQFKISYGKFGPTEMRLIAVIANIVMYFAGFPIIETSYGSIPVYDIFGAFIATALIGLFVASISKRALVLRRIGE
ncbi:MAG: CDP-alcohol phosphatidyltransferase family protein [Candidatus Promineifilaceae bacterium]